MRALILCLALASCTPVTHHQRDGFTESWGLHDSGAEAIELCRQVVYAVGIQGAEVEPDRVMAYCLVRSGASI